MSQKIVACVQARFSSNRLPGKVVKPLNGKPMIGYLLDSLKQASSLDGIVLTTSDQVSDDPVATYGKEQHVDVFRGSLERVGERVLNSALSQNADAVVRLSGDSPLLDYRLVDQAVSLFRENDVDLVTNVAKRTFPKGQSVEVISTKALKGVFQGENVTEHELEHVTPRFYAEPDQFRILNFECNEAFGEYQLSVDTAEEFEICSRVLEGLSGLHWMYEYRDFVKFFQQIMEKKNDEL